MSEHQPCDCHTCATIREMLGDDEQFRALTRALILERFKAPIGQTHVVFAHRMPGLHREQKKSGQ